MAVRSFTAYPDYEKPDHAGARGTFQLEQLVETTGGKEIDLTSKIDQGLFFHGQKDLETYLAKVFSSDTFDLDIEGLLYDDSEEDDDGKPED